MLLKNLGVLAQVGRVPALQAGGQEFDSLTLHRLKKCESSSGGRVFACQAEGSWVRSPSFAQFKLEYGAIGSTLLSYGKGCEFESRYSNKNSQYFFI